MTSRATHCITMPPRFAADIEEQVLQELIEMGYCRISTTERDLPGIHFPKEMHIGPGYIKIFAGTRVKVGSNLIVAPFPYMNDDGKPSIHSRNKILLQPVFVREADRKSGQMTVEDPWSHESYTLDVVFDPEGPDLREHILDHMHQAIMNAQIARSRSPLRRFARAIGL